MGGLPSGDLNLDKFRKWEVKASFHNLYRFTTLVLWMLMP